MTTPYEYFDSLTGANMYTEGHYIATPTVEGPVVLTSSSSGKADLGVTVTFNGTDTDAQPTISIFDAGQTFYMYFDEDDLTIKWSSGIDPALNYQHKIAFVGISGNHAGLPTIFFSLSIWTETEKRRYTWRKEGNAVISESDVPPATYLQYATTEPNIEAGVGQFRFNISFSARIPQTASPLPFFSDLDMIDGAFIKLATTGVFGLGYSQYQGTNSGIPRLGDALADVNLLPMEGESTAVFAFSDMQYISIQLRRNKDTFGNPTGSWELWTGDELQRICADLNPQVGGLRVVYMESSTQYGAWIPTYFNWGLEFNDTAKTVSIFNQDLVDESETNAWFGEGTNDNLEPWVRLRGSGQRIQYPCQFVFSPLSYEYRRYAREEELLVECCSDTVDEIGPDPIGYIDSSSDIKYEIFCPATHLPDPITSNVKTNSSGVCDPLLVEWCGRTENELKSLCACINPFDAPPLPDDSLINGFKRCFSQQCRDFGYRTAGMIIPSTGQLDCPTELCTNIINIEKGSNVEFEEAKQIIDCTDEDGGDGGDGGSGGIDTMLLIYIIVGSIVGLGIIIGISIAIAEGNKTRTEEKKLEVQEAARKRNRELTRARIANERSQIQRVALQRRQQKIMAPPPTQKANNQQLLQQIQNLLNRS